MAGKKYWSANYPDKSMDKQSAASDSNFLSNKDGVDRINELGIALQDSMQVRAEKANTLLTTEKSEIDIEGLQAQELVVRIAEILIEQGLAFQTENIE